VAGVLAALAPHADAPAPPRGRALDLACGGGRHALAAAALGFRVTAVDYARPALAQLRAAAAARGLAVDVVVADVETWPLPVARFALVMVVDFLSRRAAVAPGGVLVMETFTVGQERLGHPRHPDFLLRHGELAAVCHDWEVLAAYEHETAEPAPACRAGIAARAPGAFRALDVPSGPGAPSVPVCVDSLDPFGSIRAMTRDQRHRDAGV
jgi:SAM-dependent methyltransferase